MVTSPPVLATGYVAGRYLLSVGDSSDPDRDPDIVAASGTITITPKASQTILTSPAAFVAPRPIVCSISADGYLLDPAGGLGVYLVTGFYSVSFALDGISVPGIDPIEVTTAHTVSAPLQLPLAAELVPTPTTHFVVNEQVYLDTIAARDEVLAALADVGSGGAGGPITASQITDATSYGLGVLTAASQQDARSAIGALGSARLVSTGTGLTGGGDLTADRTIALTAAAIASLAKADTALQTAPVTSVFGRTGVVTATKTDVGLGSVDNTADTAKPVSTLQATALAAKAPLASPTFTGTVGGITKAMVGLGNVDNTADTAKPISTAQAAVNAAKADLVGGFVPTSQLPALAINDTFVIASQAAMLALTAQRGDIAKRTDLNGQPFVLSADDPTTLANWISLDGSATGAVTSVNGLSGTVVLGKTDIGLANVDNTSDVNKPVSTATTTALAAKLDTSVAGASNLYYKNSGGTVGGMAYAAAATANVMALRNTTGGVTVPTTPSSTTDAASKSYVDTADALLAPKASPTFTGTPAAPTATAGTNTTQVATTAFVAASYAPLASPALTGTPTAPTATAGDSTTKVATTAFAGAAATAAAAARSPKIWPPATTAPAAPAVNDVWIDMSTS